MPELVAILHSFVGAAAVLVGIANYLEPRRRRRPTRRARGRDRASACFVGAVTFTGSIVAFGKLRGTIGSKPLLLPGRHVAQRARWSCGCVGARRDVPRRARARRGSGPLLVITGIALRARACTW